MERVDQQVQTNDNSKKVLAIFLIIFGFLWIIKQSGIFIGFPYLPIHHLFAPVSKIFSGLSHLLFSWPMVLIFVGLVLMAGKRAGGVVLLIIGGIFILPKIFAFSGAVFMLFLPLILIGVGIAIVARLL